MKPLSAWVQGVFKKRYKRFFADVELNGKIEVAHVPNTGSLKGCNFPDQPCLVSPAENPERKLRWTLQAIQVPTGAWVGVNTSWPNQLAVDAFEKKVFPHWKDFDELKSEIKINDETRLDLLLSCSKTGKKHYVEIKNVSLAEGDLAAQRGIAKFPDAVTTRGQKHLHELMNLQKKGHTTEILFTIQRDDCASFSAAEDIDPEYAKLLKQAEKAGVRVTPVLITLKKNEIFISGHVLPYK